MSFGSSPYGTTPYGGVALVSGGITIVSASPAVGSSGASPTGPVQFTVNTPAEFDALTLTVRLNGAQVTRNSEFLAGFGGTIAFNGPDLTVNISTHPALPDGSPITVNIEVYDLAGTFQSASYGFTTGGAALSGSETLTLTEDFFLGGFVSLPETLTLTEGLSPFGQDLGETLTLTENPTQTKQGLFLQGLETLTSSESLQVGALHFEFLDSTTIQVTFPEEFSLSGVGDAWNYTFETVEGFPLTVLSAVPIVEVHHTGTQGQIVETFPGTFFSYTFNTVTDSFTPADIGRYLFITGPSNPPLVGPNDPFQIVGVAGSVATVDRPIPMGTSANGGYVPGSGFTPGAGQVQWAHTTGAKGATLKVTEGTAGKGYVGRVRNLRRINGTPYSGSRAFTAIASKPKVSSVQFLPENGTVTVTFSEPMRIDGTLLSPTEYTIAGPTTVAVRSVSAIDPQTVALTTSGFGAGSYTLTVNATGTPKDAAGNPTDPLFNQVIFTGSVPLASRSIFTDKGPIAKPPVTLQSGTGATIQTYTTLTFGVTQFTSNEVVLPGGAFNSTHVGLRLELGGSTINGGTYKISGVVNATRLRVQASFSLPDSNNGLMTWKLIDPRVGEIADDPSDVVVRVNNVPVTPLAVIGLLGQVVLPSTPNPADDVKIDYSHLCNPTVEIRRLNSREFRLNSWASSGAEHSFKYNNVTVQPSTFVPDDIQASLVQPLFRELHYHAYERAYSVALNDPNLLVLNTPSNQIAYPPLSRQIDSTTVNYSASTLPEVDPDPWVRKGMGIASVGGGTLTVQDNTTGPLPSGNPLFWTKDLDLTFPHVFAATWRMQVVASTPVGVFTGVSIGWSNDKKAVVLGYLNDAGVKKVGFLRKNYGNDPSLIGAWITTPLDWSILRSYRFFRSRDGVVSLFVDGEIIASLQVVEADLPYLEELNDPFQEIQGIFFGSLSREASNTSLWDFIRYLTLPTNPEQSAPAIFAGYEGDLLPEVSPTPWTPVGYHGEESLLGGSLILDSTSATTQATSDAIGLAGGSFRGFTRVEPLLPVSSDVVLDCNVQLRTLTHGITPNATMVAIDDGNRLVQLCFFPITAQPKKSYPGRTLPQDATPLAWTPLGNGAMAGMVGRTLRITDALVGSGLVYFVEDLALLASPDRVIAPTLDYYGEFKLKVVSYVNDGSPVGFCGATFDLFDGTRSIGLLLRETGGVRQVAFHSDGNLLGVGSQYPFEWNDGLSHIYRVVKSTIGDLVSLFIDNVLIGTYPYSSFLVDVGNPTISFGSATGSSVTSTSTVDWYYANVWRAQAATAQRYVGIWKGYDSTSLVGYYLPLKAEGQAAVAGNSLTDLTTDFLAAGVAVGDFLLVDVGADKGTYTIATVGATTLTFLESFPLATGSVNYRIPMQVDWSVPHKYRIIRDPGGSVSLFLDAATAPIIRIDYNEVALPPSTVGVPYLLHNGLPSVSWGAFDPTNLSQTAWDFVRYGITRSPTELRIVPHHQVLNQRNVMASPEHLFNFAPHDHTQFSSASTGIPYPWQDFVDNPANVAFTRLNEGTPLVPSTQTYEVRRPTPVFEFTSGLNRPEDVLNSDGDFLLNDGSQRSRIIVPNDVLYNCLQVTEELVGEAEHIAPFSDEGNPIALKRLNWTKEVCGVYKADTLPELDPGFGTSWVLESDSPGDVATTAFAGILTYSVGATPGNNTIYRNPTPLTDPVGLQTRVDFTLKVLNDASVGLGDSGIRFGFSALGLTAALAFVTAPSGDREVRLIDLQSNVVLGAVPFDYLDGAFHVYRLEKNVTAATLDLVIDP